MEKENLKNRRRLKYLKPEEIKALLELKSILLKKFSVIDFKIFGSKVKNKFTPESDIDVMIELKEYNFETEKEIDRIIFEINLKYDVLISALIISKYEIEIGPLSESPIYKIIQKEGISI